jgi:hypothetical protein
MKRIVGSNWTLWLGGFILTLAVVALTRAGEGATYLIAVGFLAIVICIEAIPERIRARRGDHALATRRRSPR